MLLRPDIPFRPGPPSATRALRPRSVTRAPSHERYAIRGGGAILVEVSAGDRVTVVSDEGGQIAEILACHRDGRSDPALLGETGGRVPSGLGALLQSEEAGLRSLRSGLAVRAIDPAGATAVTVFGTSSPAGDSASFPIRSEGYLVIAAPGGAMAVDGHDTATPLTVTVARAAPGLVARHDLPDPLADPLADIRVGAASARAYFVKAGDYIQILDVDGRQCTDFQCFSARKLDRGIEHPLDMTTTRSLIGHAYAMPGLHSKYFDQDMEPLVEVVQDTCGRHDAFALACSAKYYDDFGYPGHVNCTENFNGALAGHGVAPRAGWMAVNFFFNTGIDAHGVMYADEPWSRPGDYVLMRALTDLVCVSSACPDDTTAANGWNPTDIHVRTYAGAERFSRAVAFRPTPDAEPQMTRESAFHASFAALTRNFVEYRGFWLAHEFNEGGAIAEYHACRERAVVTDLSPLRKFEVTGPDAEVLLDHVLTRDVKKLAVGEVVYSAMCYPHGGMIDDGTLLRLGADNFRWIGGDDYGGVWLREKAAELGLEVLVRSSTDQMHNIAVQGPASREILGEIVWTPPARPSLAELGWFRFTVGRIGGPAGAPVVVSRTGYTGELGYEIFCHPKDAAAVFDAVWAAGRPKGLMPMGLAALDMVRIEAGLAFAGHEFSDETDPFEAGIGFTVPLKSKASDFIGRDALLRRKEHPSRRLVGLEIAGNESAVHGDCVHIGRARVGVVTSGMRSPLLGHPIALARVDVAHADIGTEVEIGKLDGHIKRLPAKIVAFPHYDPKKTRPRS
ncbi:DUF1989 domain-containing protein [Methylobrevis pamukkalensis]|uniref:Aminomethyltransferase n=1 Tax=Methylobrevis pamukkalensis TaxID=1439726 RepID=A0A1E3H821_9HYPH|nr:aminomethyltransferase family protein [Methylobrevis pamukkalensis]ODN71651.1 Aminomethyltransferase [Methylobrevis pamukkalensis]